MLLRLRRTKTIQFAECELLITISYVKNSALCAVRWTWVHFLQAHVALDALAFQVPACGGTWTPLLYCALQATIKSCAGWVRSLQVLLPLPSSGWLYVSCHAGSNH